MGRVTLARVPRVVVAVTAFLGLIGCTPLEALDGDGTSDDSASSTSEALSSAALLGFELSSIRKIDSDTGASTLVANLPNNYTPWYYGAFGVTLSSPRRIYQFGIGGGAIRLLGFNADTGALLSSPVVERTVDIERNSAGALVGTCETSGHVLQFCRINPTTGVLDVLNANLGTLNYDSPVTAYDPASNRYYAAVTVNNVHRLLTIDAATGALLNNPSFPAFPRTLRVNAQGLLIGMSWNENGVATVGRYDPTNTYTNAILSQIPDFFLGSEWTSPQAIDRVSNRIYQIGQDSQGVQSVYTINASTGVLLDVAPTSNQWLGLQVRSASGTTTTASPNK